MLRKQKFLIWLLGLFLVLDLSLAGYYLFLRFHKEPFLSQRIPITPGQASFPQETLYFHRIDPVLLPQYTQFSDLYRLLYQEKSEVVVTPNSPKEIIINGHGCYYFDGVPKLCSGLFAGFVEKQGERFLVIEFLDSQNKIRQEQVMIVNEVDGKQVKGVLLFRDVREDGVYYLWRNNKQVYLADNDIEDILIPGQPLIVFLESWKYRLGQEEVWATSVVYVLDFKESLALSGLELEYLFSINK